MIKPIDELNMKNILLSDKRKQELINSLTLDEKLLYGARLNYNGDVSNKVADSDMQELDGDLKFGNTTYEDGMEVYTNNKE